MLSSKILNCMMYADAKVMNGGPEAWEDYFAEKLNEHLADAQLVFPKIDTSALPEPKHPFESFEYTERS